MKRSDGSVSGAAAGRVDEDAIGRHLQRRLEFLALGRQSSALVGMSMRESKSAATLRTSRA